MVRHTPQWYGLVGVGGRGAGVCGKGSGPLELPGWWGGAGPALLFTPNPKPRLNAGSKPIAEHTPQILP